jgi:NADH:ubiquinone reductase (H+-translocating)
VVRARRIAGVGPPFTHSALDRRGSGRQADQMSSGHLTRVTPRVVVVGGGFGGIEAVKKLRGAPVEITLVDRRNFHLFQPLTYQVATGALSPSDVAYPLRSLFKASPNVEVRLAEVTGFNLEERSVHVQVAREDGGSDSESLDYDSLIVAAGSSYSYFGHDEFAKYAAEVKTLESALVVRSRILRAFERAEVSPIPDVVNPDLTFVVVGAGPTGVEMAGQIAELARNTLRRDYRQIDPRAARVILIDVGDRVLAGFPPSLSAKAAHALEDLGAMILLGNNVIDVNASGVTVAGADGVAVPIASNTVIWAAGVTASGLARELGAQSGAEIDTGGHLVVEPDLTLASHPEVIAIGDMVRVRDSAGAIQRLPGLAPVAIQQGHYAARLLRDRLGGRQTAPFRYRDKGNVATIGRASAVVDFHVIRLSGFIAWVAWLLIHLWYLIGFRNRLFVTLEWSISFLTGGRSSRLIDDPTANADSSV